MMALQNRLGTCRGYELETLLKAIETYQNEMDELMENKAKDAIIRSKAKWSKFGEKNTKYFLNLEKRNTERKLINKIKSKSGSPVVEEHLQVLDMLKSYFTTFFNDKIFPCEQEINDYLLNLNMPVLSHSQHDITSFSNKNVF